MITIGAIASAHGVRGQFKVKSFTASPDALTDYGPLQLADGRQLSLKIVTVFHDGWHTNSPLYGLLYFF